MENGGNDKYWRGQTSNISNVWWDMADHLGLGGGEEEEMGGASRPYDYWTAGGNVVLKNSHHQQQQVVVVEEEEEEVVMMMMNPPPPSIISNGGGGVAKAKQQQQQYLSSSSLYSSGSSHVYPDPHLTCLKLGHTNNNNKRRQQYYFEEDTTTTNTTNTAALWKKGKCYSGGGVVNVGFGGSTSRVVIPKCQVDGCHVELLSAREYHRRHKVCEVHSKATKVEVLGIQQRFCQQCSRFHVMTEFDDSKRSCRRRLAGHNERRRKMSTNNHNSSSSSSNDSTTSTTTTTRKCFDKGGAGGLQHTLSSSTPRVSNALSLLSTLGVSPAADHIPGKYNTVVALKDLFAENRANILASQLFLNQPISKNINKKC